MGHTIILMYLSFLEDNKYQLKKYSVGGITKTNSKKVDHKAELSITKKR